MNVCETFTNRFPKTAGETYEEKARKACLGCNRCELPPLENSEHENSEVESWLEEIYDLEKLWNVGQLNLESLDFDSYLLFMELVNLRKLIERRQQTRLQMFIKGFAGKATV